MSYTLKELNDAVRSDPKGYAEECDAIFAQKVQNAARNIADHRRESHVILLSGPSGSGKTTTALKIEEALERMGIQPESSHHEEGPGQNEVDFRYSDPLSAADNAVTFLTVVKTIAARNGLYADFSPRPLEGRPGSGFHINMSVQGGAEALMHRAMGGILDKITDMTLFLNPTEQSYSRLGAHKAPKYISWSSNNRSQLIRVPAASGEYRRFELRSPDCTANPYLAFALLIWAGLSGIENGIALPEACNVNLHTADSRNVTLATLPKSLSDAEKCAADSNFIAQHLPQSLIEFFTK